MSRIALSGDASGTGTFTIAAPNSNSSRTISIPDGTGTMVVNGASSAIVSGTSQASTSGTSIDFTGIPSWVKRITVMFQGLSTNGSSDYLIQIGSGSFTTSGYLSSSSSIAGSVGTTAFTTGFGIRNGAGSAAAVSHGAATIYLLSGNTWVENATLATTDAARTVTSAGSITLSGTLDRVRITTVNGTDAFDAGTINILYE